MLITDDPEVAKKFGEDVWKPTFVSVQLLLIPNIFFFIRSPNNQYGNLYDVTSASDFHER